MEHSTVRFAEESDAPAFSAVYAPYVRSTPVTFEYEPPDAAEFVRRIRAVRKRFPWLVFETGGEIAGYAYAAPFRSRPAYGWDAEVSIYVDRRFHRRGIGSALYRALEDLLREQGILHLYALITEPNPQSLRFHESRGFFRIATYPETGFKQGRWHDLAVLEKRLDQLSDRPAPVRSAAELPPERTEEILRRAAPETV